jgi:hypothetical protein
MIPYILKVLAGSLFFLLVYKAVFERGKMYRFNRVYLLTALAVPFVLPLVPLWPGEAAESVASTFVETTGIQVVVAEEALTAAPFDWAPWIVRDIARSRGR